MKLPKNITIHDLYIVNDYDRPEAAMIARKSRKNGLFYYISHKLRNVKCYYGMNPTNPTPLADFGICMKTEDGRMVFTQEQVSVATYRDGRARQWQGQKKSAILL